MLAELQQGIIMDREYEKLWLALEAIAMPEDLEYLGTQPRYYTDGRPRPPESELICFVLHNAKAGWNDLARLMGA